MIILAVDPGPAESAFVLYESGWPMPLHFGKLPNLEVLDLISDGGVVAKPDATHMAIEMIASYGMPVGAEVFETCVWVGRFVEAWESKRGTWCPHDLVYRRDVKLHLCGQARAKDGNVRQALIDRFGGKTVAIGNKKSPGPLRGISGDVWQALAVAVTYADGATRKAA